MRRNSERTNHSMPTSVASRHIFQTVIFFTPLSGECLEAIKISLVFPSLFCCDIILSHVFGAGEGIWTPDLLITNQLHYPCATPAYRSIDAPVIDAFNNIKQTFLYFYFIQLILTIKFYIRGYQKSTSYLKFENYFFLSFLPFFFDST